MIPVMAVATEGCATAIRSQLGEMRSDRPALIGGFRSDQGVAAGFGGNRVPSSVPTNLPLPPQADPGLTFKMPSIGTGTTNTLYEIGNGISVLLNCIPDLSGKAPRECAARADRNFREAIPQPRPEAKGPVILR